MAEQFSSIMGQVVFVADYFTFAIGEAEPDDKKLPSLTGEDCSNTGWLIPVTGWLLWGAELLAAVYKQKWLTFRPAIQAL